MMSCEMPHHHRHVQAKYQLYALSEHFPHPFLLVGHPALEDHTRPNHTVASVASAHDRLVKKHLVFDSLLTTAVQVSRPRTRVVIE